MTGSGCSSSGFVPNFCHVLPLRHVHMTSQTPVFQSNQFSRSVNLQLISRYVNDKSDHYFRPVSVGDGLYYSNI